MTSEGTHALGLAAQRLARVRSDIERAAAECGRAARDVSLLAVSKGHPLGALSEMVSLGVRDFGENYVQECVSKAKEAPWSALVHWHFIGHLQTNKVKALLPYVSHLHSLDRLSLLDALEKHAALAKHRVALFVQLEVDPSDANKHGADFASAEALCARLGAKQGSAAFPYDWVGFMGVGPAETSPEELARLYEDFAARARRLWKAHHPGAGGTSGRAPEFSLGMSSDLAEAIAAGSTLVRVGTALFGPRVKATPA